MLAEEHAAAGAAEVLTWDVANWRAAAEADTEAKSMGGGSGTPTLARDTAGDADAVRRDGGLHMDKALRARR